MTLSVTHVLEGKLYSGETVIAEFVDHQMAEDAAAILAMCHDVDPAKARGLALNEYVAQQAFINGMSPDDDGGYGIQMNGLACQLMAAAFAGQFKGSGATNYLELGFDHPETGPMMITMQRRHGKTPAQLKTEAEAERDELAQKLECATDVANEYQRMLDHIGQILQVPTEPHQGRDYLVMEAAANLVEHNRRMKGAIESLAAESAGVAGLHGNGEIAPWGELMVGGRFEEWLLPFSEGVEYQESHRVAEAIKAEMERCIRAVEVEPEYPDKAPPELMKHIREAIESKDEEHILHMMRHSVRLTKGEVTNRIRRGALKPVEVVRSQGGSYLHPALPEDFLDEGTSIDGWHHWLNNLGIQYQWDSMENDADESVWEAYYRDSSLSHWTPGTPEGNGWFLLTLHDTENGPVCLWGRKVCLIEGNRSCRGCPDCGPVMGEATYRECEQALKDAAELGGA